MFSEDTRWWFQCDLEEGNLDDLETKQGPGGFLDHTCQNEEDLEPFNCKRWASCLSDTVRTRHNIWTSLSSFFTWWQVIDLCFDIKYFHTCLTHSHTNARSKFETKEPGQREVCMGLNSLISCEVGLSTYWTENVLNSPSHAHHVNIESHQTNYCQSRHLMTRPLEDPST